MRRVFSSWDSMLAGHISNMLNNSGISARILNQYASTGIGYLPPTECQYEVWIEDSNKYQQAIEMIASLQSVDLEQKKKWTCSSCKEEIEEQFSNCWNCGEKKDS